MVLYKITYGNTILKFYFHLEDLFFIESLNERIIFFHTYVKTLIIKFVTFFLGSQLIAPPTFTTNVSPTQPTFTTNVSPIGPDELPPPYQAATQGNNAMVTCRVCQAMIDVSGKREQHVVKCNICNEATVSIFFSFPIFVLCIELLLFL